jgi:Flp pilus assembly protein TadD
MTATPNQSGQGAGASERLAAVVRALQTGDTAQATRLAVAALAAGDRHPALFNLRALDHENAGRFDAALTDLQQARALAPKDFALANAEGLCLARLDRMADAVRAFEDAAALKPDFAPAHFNRGWALEPLGELNEARRSYEQALALKPDHVDAMAHLATLATRRGDYAEARRLADRALALEPGRPAAELALASAEFGEGESKAAEARLQGLVARDEIGPHDRAMAEGQLGDALDALGEPKAAFEAYTRSNQGLRAIYAPRFAAPGTPTVSDMLKWLIDYFDAGSGAGWSRPDEAREGPVQGHVFLLGFPRSGTTLAEQALAANPAVVALEERETLHAALRDFMRGPQTLNRLKAADDAALEPYRAAYWDAVRAAGVEPDGKVFLDKNPFNTLKLPLIARLFPNARVVFALRDPRDVVFSCFRRRFGVNGATFEFLTLEGAARSYDLTMTLAARYADVLPTTRYNLVYETLVDDFEAEMRRLCAAIGLDWTPAMADFAGRARDGAVATASGGQVARGLYRDGAGQWRRYAEQMASVAARLDPWVARLGYAP